MKLYFFLVGFLVLSVHLSASHIMGGEITYQYLGNNGPADKPFRYSIRFVGAVDRVGSPLSPSNFSCGNLGGNPQLGIYDASTNLRIPRVSGSPNWPLPSHGNIGPGTCNIDPYSFPAIRPLIFPPSAACWSPGQTPFSIAITDTTFEVQLPFSSEGYYVKFETCCRANSTTNLFIPLLADDPGNTFLAFIPSPSLVNSSPQFSNDLIPVLCLGDTSIFSIAGIDPDGDNLIYALASAWSGISLTPSATYTPPIDVMYKNGFSALTPFGSYGYASINPSTGLVKLYCSVLGSFAIAYEVKEYRTLAGGTEVLVSNTRREYVLNVVAPTPPTPPPYMPLPIKDANWNIKESNLCALSPGEYRKYYTIRCNGDTVFGNKTYQKLDIPYYFGDPTASCVINSLPGEYAGAFRQDSVQRKVYYIYSANDPEELLYDFSMEVGDTLKGYLASPFPEKVVSIDSVTTIGGVIRKRWNIVFAGCPQDTARFIEGIGSITGLLSSGILCSSDVGRDTLICMVSGSTTRYQTSGVTNCNVISAKAHPITRKEIELYPNPGSEIITLQTNQLIQSIQITDGLGRLVETPIMPSLNGKQLDITRYQPGIYWLRIQTAEGTAMQKLVKE